MKTMMMFDRLVSLHRDRHRTLRLDPSGVDCTFAAQANSVPIAASEVAPAALHYPCVFFESGGRHAMCALLGLDARQNLFVDDGRWAAGTYMPAYFRRYPFALAETGTPENFLVCIDEACAGLSLDAGEPLFEAEGTDGVPAESRVLDEARQFLLALHGELTASSRLADEIARAGLLDERVVRWRLPDGTTGELSGFLVVNEDRLRQLPVEKAAQWLANGTLGLLFAHLLSLGQVERLSRLRAERQASAQSVAAPAATGAPASQPAPGDGAAERPKPARGRNRLPAAAES